MIRGLLALAAGMVALYLLVCVVMFAAQRSLLYLPQPRQPGSRAPTLLLQSGFVDSFRHLYPDKKDAYSWWSYFGSARDKNVGWRIDYFVVSRKFQDRIRGAAIHPNVFGSDHCPVELIL